VVIYAGAWVEGHQSSSASPKAGVSGNIEDFAGLGFVAGTINSHRLPGETPFQAALEDCQGGSRARARDYHLDPKPIGPYGNSAGDHLSLLLGMVAEDAGRESDVPFLRALPPKDSPAD
jgi:acetyl esterase/lipase